MSLKSLTLAQTYFIFLRSFLNLCFLIFLRRIIIMPFFACFPVSSSLVLTFVGSSIILSVISSITLLICVGFSMILLVSGKSKISFFLHAGPPMLTSLIRFVCCLAIKGLSLKSHWSAVANKKELFVVLVGWELEEMLKFLNEAVSNLVDADVPENENFLVIRMKLLSVILHLNFPRKFIFSLFLHAMFWWIFFRTLGAVAPRLERSNKSSFFN